MPKLTPAEAHEKWKNRLTSAVPDVKAGIDRVTESPTAKAAAKEDKWFAGLQRAKASGKFKRGLLNVSLEEWKTKARDVGADRIPAGAAAAEAKQTAFYAKLFPYEETLQAKIKSMPDTTIQDSVARASAWIMGMSSFDKTK